MDDELRDDCSWQPYVSESYVYAVRGGRSGTRRRA